MKYLCSLIGFLSLLGAITVPARAQVEIPLWAGTAPGAESWTAPEKMLNDPGGGQRIVDISRPTLTAYLPDPAKATGTAVIIAHGGAMLWLGTENRQTGASKFFNDRGIAVFVLKYRVLPTAWQTNRPLPTIRDYPHANGNPFQGDDRMVGVIRMAIADAHQAVRLLRANAAKWGVNPKKVGMLGYSAGGGVSIGALVTPAPGAQPDFAITAFGPSLVDVDVPANKPPIFIAVRQFHPNVARALVSLYQVWTDAGAPAELHIYDQAGGTPGLRDSDGWLEQAYAWMTKRGFASAAAR